MNFNLVMFKFTAAKEDDRVVLDEFFQRMANENKHKKKDQENQLEYHSTVVGDAGYVSKEYTKKANNMRIYFVTATRKNMKVLATVYHRKLLNLRSKVETVFSVLKERYHIVISLPRSVNGYLAHYIRSIFSYIFSDLGKFLMTSGIVY